MINSGQAPEPEAKREGRHGSSQNASKQHAINLKKTISQINKQKKSQIEPLEEIEEGLPKSKRLLKQMEKEHIKTLETAYRPNNYDC